MSGKKKLTNQPLNNDALVQQLIRVLKGEAEDDFNHDEIDQVNFMRCLIIAMLKLKIITANIEYSRSQYNENMKAFLKNHMDLAKKIHKQIQEYDADDEEFAARRKKSQEQDAKTNFPKLSPDEELVPKETVRELLQLIKHEIIDPYTRNRPRPY